MRGDEFDRRLRDKRTDRMCESVHPMTPADMHALAEGYASCPEPVPDDRPTVEAWIYARPGEPPALRLQEDEWLSSPLAYVESDYAVNLGDMQ